MNQAFVSFKNRLQLNKIKPIYFRLFRETRTQILFWYAILLFLFVFASIPITRYLLAQKINARVIEDMEEELEDFEELLLESLIKSPTTEDSINRSVETQKLYQFFDNFFDNVIAEDDNFHIAIVEGKFYKASSRILPKAINTDSELMQQWKSLNQEVTREVPVPNSKVESIIYKAIPIKTPSQTLGVFVVAHATAGERAEAAEAFMVMVRVLIVGLAIAIVLGWFAAGIILAPLKEFTSTVKSINESDLSQRIVIQQGGELAELGNTFNEMMNRLESAFAIQRNFINDAGHELRTPITIIRGHLELMDDDPQSQQETIDLVMDELDRMKRLVEDLILLTKAERPDFLQIETVEIAPFIKELFSKLKALGTRNWQLENNVFQGKIACDRQRIIQAVINLANNAVQHTTTDSLIVFGTKIKSNHLILWIRDTGEGIAIEEQKRIFNRFARVKNAPRRSDGLGLGLAIVKAVVEAHGGVINLQSKIGIGSTFTILLPLEFNQ